MMSAIMLHKVKTLNASAVNGDASDRKVMDAVT
jgi:hypothetical protein